jgi:hypothetical protein
MYQDLQSKGIVRRWNQYPKILIQPSRPIPIGKRWVWGFLIATVRANQSDTLHEQSVANSFSIASVETH